MSAGGGGEVKVFGGDDFEGITRGAGGSTPVPSPRRREVTKEHEGIQKGGSRGMGRRCRSGCVFRVLDELVRDADRNY
jgi:hypothetical protein